jgi:DtxR family Mn-dependent transcriptional regulator
MLTTVYFCLVTMREQSLTPTMEDYLEALFILGKELKAIRVKDIAKRMNVKLPTVTSMLNTLVRRGLVNHEKYEYVELTNKGLKIAREVDRYHRVLRSFLTDILQIDIEQADEEACKMEHAISPATLERLVEFMEFVEVCPRVGLEWLEYFKKYCRHGRKKDECLKHMKGFINEYSANLKKLEKEGRSKMITERPLSALSPGEKGRISKVTGAGSVRQRTLDMGVVPGAIVEIERVAPLGDPVEVKIKGYHLSLRKEEVSNVYIEEL